MKAGLAQLLMYAGSVHTVSEEITLIVYRALGTMNQAETTAKLEWNRTQTTCPTWFDTPLGCAAPIR